jgi:mannan endo-1,4-beta-mannosidase
MIRRHWALAPFVLVVTTAVLAVALSVPAAGKRKAAASLAEDSASAPTPAVDPFVRSSEAGLIAEGVPYRFTGLNVYNANSVGGNCWYSLGAGTELETALTAMGPGNEAFRAWFFQPLATHAGVRDWSAFDHTLAVARSRGMRVVATLVNQWGQCEGWEAHAAGYKTEAWYANGYRSMPGSPGMPATYREWVAEVVHRYRDDPTILAWQLVNEAEARTAYRGPCSSTAAATLQSFAQDMSGLVKSIDPNHLVSLGTIGSGQCGAAGGDYQDLHAVEGIDLCEYHDYQPGALPGDEWNGMATRLRQCRDLGKPLLVGETGIRTASAGGTLEGRAEAFRAKLDAQFAAGVVGVLAWDWRDDAHGGSSASGYEIGPSDPALAVLGSY